MSEDKEYLRKVGANIKKVRLTKKMKQIDLAFACEYEKQNMYRIEKGKNNLTLLSLRKIAKALDVTINDLIDV